MTEVAMHRITMSDHLDVVVAMDDLFRAGFVFRKAAPSLMSQGPCFTPMLEAEIAIIGTRAVEVPRVSEDPWRSIISSCVLGVLCVKDGGDDENGGHQQWAARDRHTLRPALIALDQGPVLLFIVAAATAHEFHFVHLTERAMSVAHIVISLSLTTRAIVKAGVFALTKAVTLTGHENYAMPRPSHWSSNQRLPTEGSSC